MEPKKPILSTEDFAKVLIFLVLLLIAAVYYHNMLLSHQYQMRNSELCEKVGGYIVNGVCVPPHQVREGVK